jgi:NADH:ubiquinone oxidoreductase subunit E
VEHTHQVKSNTPCYLNFALKEVTADNKLKENDIVCFQICRVEPCLTVRDKRSVGGCVIDVVERYNLQSTVKRYNLQSTVKIF